jgi:hypothetical protein
MRKRRQGYKEWVCIGRSWGKMVGYLGDLLLVEEVLQDLVVLDEIMLVLGIKHNLLHLDLTLLQESQQLSDPGGKRLWLRVLKIFSLAGHSLEIYVCCTESVSMHEERLALPSRRCAGIDLKHHGLLRNVRRSNTKTWIRRNEMSWELK